MSGAPQIGPISAIWPSSTPPATGTSGAFPSSAQASVFLSLTSQVGMGALTGSMYTFKTVPGSAVQYLRNFTWTTTKTFYGVGATGKVGIVPYQQARVSPEESPFQTSGPRSQADVIYCMTMSPRTLLTLAVLLPVCQPLSRRHRRAGAQHPLLLRRRQHRPRLQQ